MGSCNTSDKRVDFVQTPAGVFETCRVESSKGILWYGNVPIFGLVKQEMKGSGTSFQLVRYELGMHSQGLE